LSFVTHNRYKDVACFLNNGNMLAFVTRHFKYIFGLLVDPLTACSGAPLSPGVREPQINPKFLDAFFSVFGPHYHIPTVIKVKFGVEDCSYCRFLLTYE